MKSLSVSEPTGHRLKTTWKSLRRDKYLYAMVLVGVAWFFVFHYLPVYGIQIAFKRYNPFDGIWKSPWVGLHWFQMFIRGPYFYRIFRNTLLLGGAEPIQFFNRPDSFRPLYIGSGIWQSLGFSSIIYLAVLSGINPEIYEDAVICGANRFQRIIYITLPAMLPTISILLILSVGRIISVGFEKVYLMYNPLIYETADVIATYVYRMGLEQGQFSFGAAVGVFNNVVSLILVVTVNWINRRLSGFSLW